MKQKVSYRCTNCNYQPPKWVGCCPECTEWNSIVEAIPTAAKKAAPLVHLNAIADEQQTRMLSGMPEWDRTIGGGIVPGSFLILTGDPGIGKSTLLLQVAHHLAQKHRVFYFSSEESLEQVKLRAQRLGILDNKLFFSDTGQLETIIATTTAQAPDAIIIDSIQNCYSAGVQTIPGSIGQLRESAFQLMRLAKENNSAVIVSGHITKEGDIAGPKMLEHMVDGVFYLQGEDRFDTRMLRSVKNRFGNVNETGFFTMSPTGLVEIANINQELLNSTTHSPGSVLISYLEGSRPLLVELQALTIPSKFGIAQRVVTGIDQKRIVLIAAILEKYLHIQLSTHDIFFKVSGGLKVKDSASDLGIALALLSSYCEQPLPEKAIALGEISLTGHIKPVNHMPIHSNEAHKFGIKHLLIAHQQKLDTELVHIQRFKSVYELLTLFPE